ncbi:MAG: YtxH domain-containing protein [Ardenticatenaceae bacterium]|nr:YtxH domain-containing protein [Ardenticatenaceae bacterium]MCB9444751.1 YtxH domain-containing protein [Ardenticatenaceae bacterium]
MSENNNELGSFLAGFVIGGLVGAAVALILAPQSGQDTRSQIVGKSQSLREQSGERLQQYRELANSRTEEYRKRAGDSFAEARGRLQETGGPVMEQARIVLDAGKERAAQVKDQVSSYVRKGDSEAETSEGDAPEAAE